MIDHLGIARSKARAVWMGQFCHLFEGVGGTHTLYRVEEK